MIVVNYDGKELLDDCVESLLKQVYSGPLEILVVDNGSSDGSVQHLRDRWPEVKVEALPRNRGFAGGNNAGVEAATGDVIALINNDARAHPTWIARGVETLRSAIDVGAVASKIVSSDGSKIDYAGGGLAFYGHGFNVGGDQPDEGQYDRPGETLFPSGCAMFMRRQLFLDVGGFDDEYFAFFEDVDLGWRLWLMGYRVLYEPSSLVYHRHHGTAKRFGYERERFLLERNALYTILKNYEGDHLDKVVAASLWLTVERGFSFFGADRDKYDLARKPEAWTGEDEPVPALAMAHLLAVSEVGRRLPGVLERRAFVQDRRKRSDREIAPLFRQALLPNDSNKWFLQLFGYVTDVFGIKDLFRAKTNVLIITADTISAKMAGPAIRAWEMARHLAQKHEVRMLVHRKPDLKPDGFELHLVSKSNLARHLDWSDIVIFQGFILYLYPDVASSGKILVADIYDPFHLESLEMLREAEPERRMAIAGSDLGVINEQLRQCDYFICASDKQRDFWLGQLAALGRVNPHTYDTDPTLRELVEVVPFGIPQKSPEQTRGVLKGVVPGIGPEDRVILWGGGIYNWFDPLTVIRAVDKLRERHPELKLFFMGLAHPNPDVPEMRMAVEARRLSSDLGLDGSHVFFNEDWVEYADRANYLLESDIGVSCHHLHVETTFSYRTRVLDYFWAGLPVIATTGDALSELVERRGLGLTVAPGDVDGFAEALRRMLEEPLLVEECKRRIAELRPELTWARVLDPLDRFCSEPVRAPDKLAGYALPGQRREAARRRSPLHLAKRVVHYRKRGGWKLVRLHVRNYMRGVRAPTA